MTRPSRANTPLNHAQPQQASTRSAIPLPPSTRKASASLLFPIVITAIHQSSTPELQPTPAPRSITDGNQHHSISVSAPLFAFIIIYSINLVLYFEYKKN
ncbi:hypothetical protein RYX36_031293 [Vicia faba]